MTSNVNSIIDVPCLRCLSQMKYTTNSCDVETVKKCVLLEKWLENLCCLTPIENSEGMRPVTSIAEFPFGSPRLKETMDVPAGTRYEAPALGRERHYL